MKLYAYRSKTNKHFMITAKSKAGILDVLQAWFKECETDFSTYQDKFELITLEVEEDSAK